MTNFNLQKTIPLSAIATVYNDSASILDFLINIQDQSYLPSELIVVDGGSDDNTLAIIEDFSKKSVLKITCINDGSRKNISEGLNHGIKLSSTEHLLIIGTGNIYEKKFIEELWTAKEKSINSIFYSSVLGIEGSNFSSLFNDYFLNGNRCFDWEPSNHGVMIKKQVFRECGLFWEKFHYAGEDTEFFKRVKENGFNCEYVSKAILYWETPSNWHEYNKKMKVNAIADLQIFSNAFIVRRTLLTFLLLFLLIGLFYISSIFFFLPLFAFIWIMHNKKTYNIVAILLGISSKFLLPYHYLNQRKFGRNNYKVTKSEKL